MQKVRSAEVGRLSVVGVSLAPCYSPQLWGFPLWWMRGGTGGDSLIRKAEGFVRTAKDRWSPSPEHGGGGRSFLQQHVEL